jgi:hypothetical protein
MPSRPRIRLVFAAAVLSCVLVACSKPAAQVLPGVWLVDGPSARSIEFRADGTAQMRVRKAEEGPPAKWVVAEPGKLKLTFGEGGRAVNRFMSFELKGDDDLSLKAQTSSMTAHYSRVSMDALARFTPLPPADWVYLDRTDPARGTAEHRATATSGEQADGSTIDLVLRRHGADETTIELNSSARHPPFSCARTCAFDVRLDDRPATALAVEASPDGRGFTVSFKDGNALLKQLKAAERVQVDARIVDHGIEPFEFKVSGLRWP